MSGVDGATRSRVTVIAARQSLVVVAAIALLALAALPAHAGKFVDSYFPSGTTSGTLGGQFNGPRDVAVRESTGQIYVVDDNNHRVQRFSAEGTFELAWGRDVVAPGGTNDAPTANWAEICVVAAECKAGIFGTATDGPGGEFDNPQGIAVNQATGHVYVRDRDNRRVQQFDADGVFIRAWGADVITNASPSDPTGVTGFQICEVAADCKAGVSGAANGQFANSTTANGGVAIDPTTGDVFVADPGTGNRRVQQFQSDGDFVAAFGSTGSGLGQFATNQPGHVAVDANGIVYASDGSANGSSRVQRYDTATGSFLEPIGAPPLLAGGTSTTGTMGLEIDAATGNLMVLRDPNAAGVETVVQEIDPSGALVDTHGQGAGFAAVNGLGINAVTGELYVSTSAGPAGGGHRVYVLDDDGADPRPEIALDPPLDVGAHSARLEGTINPNGTPFTTSYRFEISKNGVDWTTVGSDIDLGNGTDAIDVSQDVQGLEANTFYRVRIVTTRSQGAGVGVSSELTFSTDRVAPEVSQPAVQHRTAAGAQLVGLVNPNNLPTTYWFEYGTTAAYGTQVPVPAASMPVVGTDTAVAQQIAGLQPNTTYHFRLVAQNSEGQATTTDATFTTRLAQVGAAPQDRGYEMVTSPDKVLRRGGEHGLGGRDFNRFQPALVSPDGESVIFNVFAGAVDPDAGSAFANDFTPEVRRRSDGGWTPEATFNLVPQFGADGAGTIFGGVSTDFRVQVWNNSVSLFPSGEQQSTRVMGDDGGPRGHGWYPWVDPAWYSGSAGLYVNGAALVDDEGERMVRWFTGSAAGRDVRPQDDAVAPNALTPPQTSGRALFLSGPGVDWRPGDLVNECTGSVVEGTATGVPARVGTGVATDLIGVRGCGEGSPTSVRGAALGAGSLGAETGRSLSGTATTAMSDDGRRIFFLSPDAPSEAGSPSACASGPGSVGAGTDCPPQLFVRQIDSAGNLVVRWISQAVPALRGSQEIGQLGNGVSFEGASRDGSVVYFRTNAPLTPDDPNGGLSVTTGAASLNSWDLYRYELPADYDADPANGDLTRVTAGPDPGAPADPNTNCSEIPTTGPNAGNCVGRIGTGGDDIGGRGGVVRFMSDSGDRVYFVTASPISGVPGTPPTGGATVPGGTPLNVATRNLYAYDASESGAAAYRFIARIPFTIDRQALDGCASSDALAAGPPRAGGKGRLVRGLVSANCVHGTRSGDAVVFETTGQLTGDDTDSAGDVYLYTAEGNELTRVSAPAPGSAPYLCLTDSDGAPLTYCNGDLGMRSDRVAPWPQASPETFGLAGFRHYNIAENPDGSLRAVYFESRLKLDDGDVDGGEGMDVYEWRDGELSLMSPRDSDTSAFFTGSSRDGEDVFFWTEQPIDGFREIDPADGDIYNARIGGGFPTPAPPAAPCAVLADACQTPGSGGSIAVTPQTPRAGGGDASPGVRPQLAISGLGVKARRRAARTGVLRLRVRSAVAGRVSLVGRARVRNARGRLVDRRVARAAARLAKPGSRTVALRLNRLAVGQLSRGRALQLRVRVIQAGAGARARSVTVLLRRPGR